MSASSSPPILPTATTGAGPVADALAPDDRALIAEIARSTTTEPLAALYARHARTVMALLLRILRSRADAEELLHEVFLEIWRRAPDYDPGRASVASWVLTIARSRAIDLLRARGRRPLVDGAEVEVTAPESVRPDAVTSLDRRRRAVHAALETLTGVQRRVLELAYFDGLSHSEIAATLGIPIGTVKSRTIAAMTTLRTSLADHAGGAP